MRLKLDKVLIVEPKPVAATMLLDWFSKEWGKVDLACCAYDAVQIIDAGQNNYDFIFLDLNLPDAVGEDAVKIIMAASNRPVVARTGDIELAEKLEEEGVNIGVYGVVREEPVQWLKHQIITTIRGAIDAWQLARVNLFLDTKERALAEQKAKWRRDYLGTKK